MRVPLIAAMLVALSAPARSECLPSAEAVWSANPGSHATWRMQLPGREGTKCWFARGSTNQEAPRVRQVVDSPRGSEADRRTDGQMKGASSPAKPSTVDQPGEMPARSESQQTVPLRSRAPSSILIWGRPMRIDPTWEEIFEKRERGAE